MTSTLASPTLEGMTVTQPPAPPQSAPPYMLPPPAPSRRSVLPTAIVALIAVAALAVGIVSLATRPAAAPAAAPSPAPAAPSFTAADRAAAKEHACTTSLSVLEAVGTATNAPDQGEPIGTAANARAAIATGALVLSRSTTAATPPDVSKAVNGLVDAYQTYLLSAFGGSTAQNDADHAAVVKATDRIHAVCG